MAISDRIQSIEEHIKESYQELEGIGIDTTGVNKNLENIPKLIDGYWETLPKVTGEGTSITLDNTKEGKMKIDLKGNTSQEGTPTPETPQDIHVVSGDNSIDVCGKNLFLEFSIADRTASGLEIKRNSDNTLLIKGTSTAIVNNWINNLDISLNSGTYTFSTNYDLRDKITIVLKDNNSQNITQFNSGKSATFSINETTIFNQMLVQVASGVTIDNSFTFQLEKGSTATTYKPYQSQSYPITLPEGMFLGWIPNTDYRDIIFQAKTGDTYYDSLNSTTKESLTYGKWYLNKQIGKVVLNGTQNITLASSGTRRFNATYTTLGISNVKEGTSAEDTTLNYRMNDHFIYSAGQNTWGRYYLYNNWLVMLDSGSTIASANDLKIWLSNNNTTIYYVLATPTYTEITDSTLLSQLEALNGARSYTTQTNINQVNNDNASVLNASALSE